MNTVRFLDLKRLNQSFEPGLSDALARVARSGWYLRGQETENFETEFAHFNGLTGRENCVGVGNGLDALTLIWKAYQVLGLLAPGDEVIVPANTYIASVLSLTNAGLAPVLAEPDELTYNLNPQEIEKRITSRTKAILVVHLYGKRAEMEAILTIAKKYNLLVIEDSAQGHGILPTADAAAFSFYPGKNLGALGDGGAVVSANTELVQIVRSLGNYGSAQKYFHDHLGSNSRLDELQAAVLSLKLKRLREDNQKRSEIANFYIRNIQNKKIRLPQPEDSVWHLFVVRCEERDVLQKHLRDGGVETLVHYPVPPHRQRCYQGTPLSVVRCPVAERLAESVLSIPMDPMMTRGEMEFVVTSINDF
jgi:dTDP-4-amino-4,6-dideoxygalactose transaminase